MYIYVYSRSSASRAQIWKQHWLNFVSLAKLLLFFFLSFPPFHSCCLLFLCTLYDLSSPSHTGCSIVTYSARFIASKGLHYGESRWLITISSLLIGTEWRPNQNLSNRTSWPEYSMTDCKYLIVISFSIIDQIYLFVISFYLFSTAWWSDEINLTVIRNKRANPFVAHILLYELGFGRSYDMP